MRQTSHHRNNIESKNKITSV